MPSDQEHHVPNFADLLTLKAQQEREALHGLRQAAGIPSEPEGVPKETPLQPEPTSPAKTPLDPKTENLATERTAIEKELRYLDTKETELRNGELSDDTRKRMIGIARKRGQLEKRLSTINQTIGSISTNTIPPDATFAYGETEKYLAPQYWKGAVVAETLEPATMIDEEQPQSPTPMESSARRQPEPVSPEHASISPATRAMAEHVLNGGSVTQLPQDEHLRSRVAETVERLKQERATVLVKDLEREDLAATEIPAGEIEAEDRHETPVAETPVTIPVADTEGPVRSATTPETPAEGAPTPFETSLRSIHDRDPEQANRILNTIEGKDGPIREKFLKAIAATETERTAQVERAQKSLSEKMFGFVKNMGEQYKSLSFGKKVALGMALTTAVAGGMLLSGATLPVALTAGFTGKRIYGAAMTGMVTAIAVEASRKRYHEKKNGGERTETEAAQDRRRALLMGLLASGGVLAAGQAISGATQIYEHFSGSTATAARIAELKQELGLDLPPREETSLLTNDPGPAVGTEPAGVNFNDPDFGKAATETIAAGKIEVTIKSGDNLWNLITEKMDAQGLTANLTADQKTYFIDSLKDKFAAMSPDELKAIGIGSGNIDMIRAGETIDLTKVLGDTQFVPSALHNAEMFNGNLAPTGEHVIEQVTSAPAGEHLITPEDLPASITETPVDQLPEHPIPQAAPENVLRDGSGEVVRDGFGDPVRTGENLLDHAYTREHFSEHEISRLGDAVSAGPEKGLPETLNVIYPPTDGEVWTVGEKSASWASMKGQSAWELFYRPESLDPALASNPSTPKLRAFMQGLTEYNIQPERSETVEGFLKRALATVAEKSPNKTWSA